jgi:hypothetical protein
MALKASIGKDRSYVASVSDRVFGRGRLRLRYGIC